MNREERREHLTDHWLDAALKQYGNAEPPAGLESRILATFAAKRARSSSPVSRSPFFAAQFPLVTRASLLAAAAAVLIAVAGIGVVRMRGPSPSKQVAGINTSGATSPDRPFGKQVLTTGEGAPAAGPTPRALDSSAGASPVGLSQSGSHRMLARKKKQPHTTDTAILAKQAPPRRDQFPSSMPLTDEERLLLTYLRATPKEEVLLVAQRQAEREKEIQELNGNRPAGPISKRIN